MIFTAYLDESGTHGESPVTIMAGVLATAEQWARYEAEFAKLKLKHGFNVFHTKKFKRRTGDFRGWNPFQQLALVMDLGALTERAFTEAVVFTLDNADYEATYKGGDKPRRLRIESKYGLCFRNCLIFLILEAIKQRADKAPQLHIVLESGHKNWSEVRDIFHEVKKEMQSFGAELLGDITFADKDSCDPLMMADFLAHAAFMTHSQGVVSNPNEQPFLERAPPPLPDGQSGVTTLRFAPGGLTDLKSVLIEKLKATQRDHVPL